MEGSKEKSGLWSTFFLACPKVSRNGCIDSYIKVIVWYLVMNFKSNHKTSWSAIMGQMQQLERRHITPLENKVVPGA